jgi:hypothetical protein
VKAAVDFPDVRYALIEGVQTETGHEYIVIAYASEKSLRDLLAAPSILAFGFFSRDEALAASRACLPTVADQRTKEPMVAAETNRPHQGLKWAEARGETASLLRRLGRFLAICCSDVVTSTAVIFSSSNTVSTAIRMALGSSV